MSHDCLWIKAETCSTLNIERYCILMVYCFICLLDQNNGISHYKKKTTIENVTNACTIGGGISVIRHTVQRALGLNVVLIVVRKCLSARGSLRINTEKCVTRTGRFVLRSKREECRDLKNVVLGTSDCGATGNGMREGMSLGHQFKFVQKKLWLKAICDYKQINHTFGTMECEVLETGKLSSLRHGRETE